MDVLEPSTNLWHANTYVAREIKGEQSKVTLPTMHMLDACPVIFTCPKRKKSEYNGNVSRICAILQISRGEFFLISYLSLALQSEVYRAENNKPFPILVFSAEAMKELFGVTGRIGFQDFTFKSRYIICNGRLLHPEMWITELIKVAERETKEVMNRYLTDFLRNFLVFLELGMKEDFETEIADEWGRNGMTDEQIEELGRLK